MRKIVRTNQLVSPFGRDVAQRQRGLESADMAFQIRPDTNLSVRCPLSHLLRKCQLSQRESREAGANFSPLRAIQTCLSLWERCRAATERACIDYVLSPVCLMRTGQCPALSVICFANASSPKGRAEKASSRGSWICRRAKTEGVLQIDKIRMRFALTRTCSHVCPLSHLLCKCQLSQRESREAGANRTPDEPSGRLCRLARVLLLPSRLAPPSSERKASFSPSFRGGEQGKLAAMKAQFTFRLQAAEFGG